MMLKILVRSTQDWEPELKVILLKKLKDIINLPKLFCEVLSHSNYHCLLIITLRNNVPKYSMTI